MPEQGRSALTAKPPMDTGGFIGHGAVPLQVGLVRQQEVLVFDARICTEIAVKTPTFSAMAVHHVPERAIDFVSDRSA